MAGQNLERRDMLRALSLAAGAAQFTGFEKWAFAFPESHQHGSTTIKQQVQLESKTRYKPQFFTADEFVTISRLSEMIIPTDNTPGAREAGVSEFIDFIVFSDQSLQFRFRYGIRWIDAHARYLFKRPFLELTPDQQT